MTWSSFEKDKLLTESWRKFLHEEDQTVYGINSEQNTESLISFLSKNKDAIGINDQQITKIITFMLVQTEEDEVVLEAMGDPQRDARTFSSDTTTKLNSLIGGLKGVDGAKLEKVLNRWAKLNTVTFEKPAAASSAAPDGQPAPPSPATTPEPDEPSTTDASTARAASASAAAAIRATPPRTTSGSDVGWTPYVSSPSSSAPPTPAAADIDVEKINSEIKERYNKISPGNRLPAKFDIWKTSILDIEGVKTIEKKIVKTGDSRQPLFVIELSNGKKFGLPPQMDFDNIKNLFNTNDTVRTDSRLKKVIKLATIENNKITTKGLVGITG